MIRSFQLLSFFIALSFTSFAAPKFWFEKEIHDFGAVKEGDKAVFEFVFENNGDDTLKLSNVKASCGCTTPFWTRDPVAPGESGKIKVSYNSHGRPGSFIKTITITSNAEGNPKRLKIKGVVIDPELASKEGQNGTPKLDFYKYEHYFGKIEVHKNVNYKFKVSNNGDSPMKILRVDSGCRCINYAMDKETIPAGGTATLEISYKPHDINEELIDIAVVKTNDPVEPYKEFTLKAEVVKTLSQPSMLQQNSPFGF